MRRNRDNQVGSAYKGLASNAARYFAIGLLVCLLCVIALLNRSYFFSKILSFVFIYLLGSFYVYPLILGALIGLYYVIRHRPIEFEITGTIVSSSFIIFFCATLVSKSDVTTIPDVFSTYSTYFSELQIGGLTTVIESNVNGGIIGYIAYSALFSVLGRVFTIVVIVIGLVLSSLFFIKPIIDFGIHIYKKQKDKHSKIIKTYDSENLINQYNQETYQDEYARKQEDAALSRIKVKDMFSNEDTTQPVFVNQEQSEADNQKKRIGQIFNVFTDSLTEFSGTPVEKTTVKKVTEGFDVFTDNLFETPVSSPVQQPTNTYQQPVNQYQQPVQQPVNQYQQPINEYQQAVNENPNPQIIEQPRREVKVNPFFADPAPTPVVETYQEPVQQPVSTPQENSNLEVSDASYNESLRRARRTYKLPQISLLNEVSYSDSSENNTEAELKIVKLNAKFSSLGIKAQVHDYKVAPAFTRFEIEVSSEVKIGSFNSIKNDLMMALSATHIDILAPIPGTSYVGIDVPNIKRAMVTFKETFIGLPFDKRDDKLLIAAGKDIVGKVVSLSIDDAPHLLVAGATGTGKSVCLNTIISSILMRSSPDDVKLIMVDPKKVEFTAYTDVPHLLCPVITDAKKATMALKKLCVEMDNRYSLLSKAGKKKISLYNNYASSIGLEPLPYIVVILDELGDLMTVSRADVEESILRITQLGRAAGIHLVVATQRPSVDVITGVIKANIASRIAFAVSSVVDSRTILDESGAENLLGMGDMLVHMSGSLNTLRVQGAFVSDEEIDRIVDYCKSQRKPEYNSEFLNLEPPEIDTTFGGVEINSDKGDDFYVEVLNWLPKQKSISTSYLQRCFGIGYPKAASILDKLEAEGYISESNGSKAREIYYDKFVKNNDEY